MTVDEFHRSSAVHGHGVVHVACHKTSTTYGSARLVWTRVHDHGDATPGGSHRLRSFGQPPDRRDVRLVAPHAPSSRHAAGELRRGRSQRAVCARPQTEDMYHRRTPAASPPPVPAWREQPVASGSAVTATTPSAAPAADKVGTVRHGSC